MTYIKHYLEQNSQEGRPPPSSIKVKPAPQRWTIYCHLTNMSILLLK